MQEELSSHHDTIWGILWYSPLYLPCQPYLCPCTCLLIYSNQQLGRLCHATVTLLPNQRCIATFDGIRRQLALGFPKPWLKVIAHYRAFYRHACHLASSQHCRFHADSRPCSLTSTWAALGLNLFHRYIYWSYSGLCVACTCCIQALILDYYTLSIRS